MKRKFKKLSLNTETLGSLSDPSLKGVAGGTNDTMQGGSACNCTSLPESECTVMCSACTINCTYCGIGCSAPCG